MKTNCGLVAEFMRSARQSMPFTPTAPSTDVRDLRLRLLNEELKEVKRAATKDDLPGLAKELCDLLYVTYGMGLAYGLPMDTIFKTVHQSNMTKFGPDGPIKDASGKVQKSPFYRDPMPEITAMFEDMAA